MLRRRNPAIDFGPFAGRLSCNLSQHKFSYAEKQWIASQINGKLITAKALAEVLFIKADTLSNIARKIRKGAVAKIDAGAPRLLDEQAMIELDALITLKGHKLIAAKMDDFRRMVAEKARETLQRAGQASYGSPVSKSFLYSLLSTLNARTTVRADTKTRARLREEADPRNFFVEACLLEVYSKNLPPLNIINMDAVQYACGLESVDIRVVYKKEGDSGPVSRNEEDTDSVGLMIKVYNQLSSSGACAEMVNLIADKHMGPTDFWVEKVPGLSATTDAAGFVWLCCTKTRGGNDKFYQWFAEHSIALFIDKCKPTWEKIRSGFDRKPDFDGY